MQWSPSFKRQLSRGGEERYVVGHEVVDEFLEFVAARARPNTVRAYAHDLCVFFSVVTKDPAEVTTKDVLNFVTAQRRSRTGAENVVRISDGLSGLSAATIKRRLAAVSCLYGYLITRDDTTISANPVPRGIVTRQSRGRSGKGLPLVRGVRRLPRILDPDDVEVLFGELRTERDRAMVQAMLLGGLRRCEVLGLRLSDLRLGEWRVFVAEGKGGHERLVPISPTFFGTVARYMDDERPETEATRCSSHSEGRGGASPSRARGSKTCCVRLVRVVDWRTGPVTSCAIPASPACARRACPSRPSRPRPDIAPSTPPGSICTWGRTGWPRNTAGPQKPSRPRRWWGWPDERTGCTAT